MEANDSEFYKKIGFLCGIEVHQRLATKEKLFCSCSTGMPPLSEKPIASIRRHQRAVAGELGSVDLSAQYEEFKDREFTYNIYGDNTCLVEIDEEPPHELNKEALSLALAFSKSLSMEIIDEFQVMRKSVVDGSDPSAFQRTILIGLNGSITTPEGLKVMVQKLFLEEESSGIESSSENSIVYNTDRLGIPLVEIDTDPYIPTPAAAKSVALAIGMLLRISGGVQRGLGTIRQDVNVSIRGGARAEIKGLQELDLMDKFIMNEITRQMKLLEIKDELKQRNPKIHTPKDITEIFADTSVKIIKTQLAKNGAVAGFRLEGFSGLLGKEVNPDRRLGSEISDYAKAAGVHGIIHSDENLDRYGFSDDEKANISKALGLGKNDAFILIAGQKSQAMKAASLAVGRAEACMEGIPLETRGVANTDLCTTRFLRPLPTGSRMYPETDVKPIGATKEMLDSATANAPDSAKEHGRLKAQLSSAALADSMLLSPRLGLYKRVASSLKIDSSFVANILLQKFTELKRSGFDVDSIPEASVMDVFSQYADGSITKQAVDELLKALSSGKRDVPGLVRELKLERIRGEKLLDLVNSTTKEAKSGQPDEVRRLIMSKYRLNVDGSELNEMLLGEAKT
jgi:glutamyl-tRNA(Gln) amidotransferase subunit E